MQIIQRDADFFAVCLNLTKTAQKKQQEQRVSPPQNVNER
jgi:hypothetical protein